MRLQVVVATLLAAIGLLVLPGIVAAEGAATAAPALSATQAQARIEGRAVPDIPLRLADGRETTLFELGRERALLVTFFYSRCTGVCTPFLQWIGEATAEVGGLGSEYMVLALSFDEADSAAQLRAQAQALGLSGNRDWQFAITDRAALAAITGALEFWYRRTPDAQQYDHDSLLVAIRDGQVIRALGGGPGQTQRLRELVWELRGRVAPYYPVQREPALRCLAFDARTGSSHLSWGMLVLVLPALAALAASLVLFRPGRGSEGAGRS